MRFKAVMGWLGTVALALPLASFSSCGSGVLFVCNLSSTWSTTDTFSGIFHGVPANVFGDSRGNLFAFGSEGNSASTLSNAILRRSTDRGTTWSAFGAPYHLAGGAYSAYRAITEDSSGNFLMLGDGDAGGATHALYFRSADRGVTWSTPSGTNDYTYMGLTTYGGAILAIPSSSVVVSALESSGSPGHIVIRRSTDGGLTWSGTLALDYVQAGSANGGLIRHLSRGPDGKLYALGMSDDATTYHAMIFRSTDNGASWGSPWADYAPASDGAIFESMVHYDSQKMAVGGSYWTGSNEHAFVRVTTNGGASWTTVLDDQHTAGQPTVLTRLLSDGAGNLYVLEGAFDGANMHGIIKKGANWGASWTTLDDYAPASDGNDPTYQWYRSSGMAFSAAGSLVAQEYFVSPAGAAYWTIRMAACN